MTKFNSLAGRLTFWYAAVFSCCFLATFGAFYILMSDNFHRWTDSELKQEVVEISVAYSENGIRGIMQQFKQEKEAAGEGRYLGRGVFRFGKLAFNSFYFSVVRPVPGRTR